MVLSKILWKIRFFLGICKARMLKLHLGKSSKVDYTIKYLHPQKIQIGKDCEIRHNTLLAGRSKTKKFGLVIADKCRIKDGVSIDAYGGHIVLGNNVLIGRNCSLLGNGGIEIGNDTMIGHNVLIVANNHIARKSKIPFQEQGFTTDPIYIATNVWIGGNCTILANSHIQEGVIVGAGSVVRGKLESGYLYAGNPVKKIKKISMKLAKDKKVKKKDWTFYE